MFSESSFGINLQVLLERNLNPTTAPGEPQEQHLGEVWQGTLKFNIPMLSS